MLVLLALACAQRAGPLPDPPLAASPAAEVTGGAVPDDPNAPTFGDLVEREARYVIMPVMGGKRLQSVTLLFDDGEAWIRAYRPIRDELIYADKRVVVTGRPYWNSPMVQSVMATHFALESIALAPGETPYATPPTAIPPPPLARTVAEILARDGLWVHAVGTLESIEPDPEGSAWWRIARLRLADGVARVPGVPSSQGELESRVGQTVTVLGRVSAGDAGPTLYGPVRICEGEVTACQMDQDNFGAPAISVDPAGG